MKMYAQNDDFPSFSPHEDDMWSIFAVSRGVWRKKGRKFLSFTVNLTHPHLRDENFLIFFREREKKKRKRFLMYADIEVARWKRVLEGVLISFIVVGNLNISALK
jgi:hypothetical protein